MKDFALRLRSQRRIIFPSIRRIEIVLPKIELSEKLFEQFDRAPTLMPDCNIFKFIFCFVLFLFLFLFFFVLFCFVFSFLVS